MLERVLQFTAARHRLLAENVVNVDTPNYRQRDLSIQAFQQSLAAQLERRRLDPHAALNPDAPQSELNDQLLYHDGNNRSMERLMSDQAKNALMHNMAVELLRKQFQQMELALKDRPV